MVRETLIFLCFWNSLTDCFSQESVFSENYISPEVQWDLGGRFSQPHPPLHSPALGAGRGLRRAPRRLEAC